VIAGTFESDRGAVAGPIQGLTTEALFFDVELPPGGSFVHPVKSGHHAFAYPYEGSVRIGSGDAARVLASQRAGVLADGDRIEISAEAEGARFILLAGRPLREPVVQYGPFVMNTREEIEQALTDYQSGKFGQATA
jgi:redox-sensitive bicupin YhaK (pirin superfamily)